MCSVYFFLNERGDILGFNLYNLGLIRECWIENGTLCFISPVTSQVTKCNTSLNVSVPRQLNIFYSPSVAFLLEAAGKKYIGRYDGKVSIYAGDNLLIGLQDWEPPAKPHTKACGYWCNGGVTYDIHLNLDDGKTLFCGYRNMEARLKGALPRAFDLTCAVQHSSHHTADGPWYIYEEGGKLCETEQRSVQEALWRRDCPSFI